MRRLWVGLAALVLVSAPALAQEAPPPPQKRGFVAVFYTGATVFLGGAARDLDPGLRLGAILGGRVHPRISLGGELALDVLNPQETGSRDVSIAELDLSFSPLLHVPAGKLELVAGPRVGVWVGSQTLRTNGQTVTTGRSGGGVLGLNLGLFAPISRAASLGGLVSFTTRRFSEHCQERTNGIEICASVDFLPDAEKVLGLTGALLF
jgi:hypothetical protein